MSQGTFISNVMLCNVMYINDGFFNSGKGKNTRFVKKLFPGANESKHIDRERNYN